jgi:hypothetical protein
MRSGRGRQIGAEFYRNLELDPQPDKLRNRQTRRRPV